MPSRPWRSTFSTVTPGGCGWAGDGVLVTQQPEWVEFGAVVEALPWGRNVYTVLRVEDSLVRPPRRQRTAALIRSLLPVTSHLDGRGSGLSCQPPRTPGDLLR